MDKLQDYNYMNLPSDLSGSRTKNRFRNEVLWGLKKLLEVHLNGTEYTIVFDYLTDIEVHLNDNNEYYQLKTKKSGYYSLSSLLKNNKNNSILGQLYRLRFDENKNEINSIIICIVSNLPLKVENKVFDNQELTSLTELEEKYQTQIIEKISQELKAPISIENVSFVRTGIDLNNPQSTLIGELTRFLHDYKNAEPKKVLALYNLLEMEINNKSCYENELNSYKNVLREKGINNLQFDALIDRYYSLTDIVVEKTKKYIEENNHSISLKRDKIQALSTISLDITQNKSLIRKKTEIKEYFNSNSNILDKSIEEIINEYLSKFKIGFIEYQDPTLEVLIIMVLIEIEEGVL